MFTETADDTQSGSLAYLWRRYVPIMVYLTGASLREERAKLLAGALWWILDPIIHCLVYYFVFALIFQTRTENFLAFLLISLLTWRWLSMSILAATGSITANAGIMRQVHVPKLVFPLQTIGAGAIKFLVTLPVLVLFLLAIDAFSPSTAIWVLVTLLISLCFVTGVGLPLSLAHPFVPDLSKILQYLFRGLLFVSGIFYESAQVPASLRDYYYLNPFVTLIESVRDPLLYGRVPNLEGLALIGGIGLALCALSFVLHKHVNRLIPRYLV